MSILRTALVTPLTGPLVRFGRESATGLSLWAEHVAELPPLWTGVHLDVLDANPDPEAAMRAAVESRPDVLFGPYGSSPMVAAARVTNRAIWNHGGATSALSRPGFPHVINVLSSASSYFTGVLEAVRAVDPGAGAVSAAGALGFQVRVVPFKSGHAASAADALPRADVLLVVGGFEDEVAAARVLLPGGWRAAAFVGAGVEEVLAPLGGLREGLLGPAQWIAAAAPEPDEGPDAGWFVDEFRRITGSDPSYPAAQAFAAGVLCARCLRDGGANDAAQLAAAHQLECTTLYGRFRLDPVSGLQVGHEVLVVQWQDEARRVVWPPGRAESSLRYPLGD